MPHYEIIIVPVGKAVAANQDANKVDRGRTSKTFTVGLSPTGKEPVTHYWCCWWMSDTEVEQLKKDFDPAQSGGKHQSKMFDMRVWKLEQILSSMKLKRIETKPFGFVEEVVYEEIIYSDFIASRGNYIKF